MKEHKEKKLIIITTVPETVFLAMEEQIPYFIKNRFNISVITSPGTWITSKDIVYKYGIKVTIVNFIRKISPLKDVLTIIKLVKILWEEKPDILHVSTPKASFLTLVASKFLKIPFVLYTIRGIPYQRMKGLKRLLFEAIERFCCYSANQILAVSRSNYDFLIDHRLCQESKLKVINKGSSHGVDYNKFDPNKKEVEIQKQIYKKYGLSKNDFIFGFVGRMVKDKGIEDLAEAWKEFSKKNKGVQLVLVGPQIEPRDMVSKECYRYLNNEKTVHLVNDVKNPYNYYSIFSVVILPSYREGFPNVILEAGSMGLPSITSDSLGCIDSVIDGETGLVFETGNVKQLVEKMEMLYNNNKLIEKIRVNVRGHIIKNYDPIKIADEILKIYRKGVSYG